MTDILDLQDWKVLETRLDGGEYEIEAEYTVLPDVCQKCGVVGNLYRHGPKPIAIRDSPIRGRPVRILAKAQRFKCRDCGGTFIQPLGGIHAEMRMTERCVEYIESQCLRDTFLRVAEHVGCDSKTVRNVAGDYIEQLNAEYKPWLPEWLGIDETQIDGIQRCVITDVVNRIPIDMLPDREKPTVTAWLHQFKDRRVVKGLATAYPANPVALAALLAANGRCESCHGVFGEGELKPSHVAAVVRGEHRKQCLICESCFTRFHTAALEARKSRSTQ